MAAPSFSYASASSVLRVYSRDTLSRGLQKTLTVDGMRPLQPAEAQSTARAQTLLSLRAVMQTEVRLCTATLSHRSHIHQDIRPLENLHLASSQHAHQCASDFVSFTLPQSSGKRE